MPEFIKNILELLSMLIKPNVIVIHSFIAVP